MSQAELREESYLVREGEQTKSVILFLAADPVGAATPQLRIGQEVRDIEEALRKAELGDRFSLHQQLAVRVTDIQECLLRHRPEIVHFSGHGSNRSEIILEDVTGHPHPVSVHALDRLFDTLKDNIQCVVLNACYSEKQAQAIAQHIDCVVGMTKAINDSAAIAFSVAFYRALGYGRDMETAFELGCGEIALERLGDQAVPKLLALRQDPKDIVLAARHVDQTPVNARTDGERNPEEIRDALQTKTRYRMEKIRAWRDCIENHDWHTHFGSTAWYTDMRPHLKPDVVARIEAPRTYIVPAEGRGGPAVKYILLDEVSRIEIDWGLI